MSPKDFFARNIADEQVRQPCTPHARIRVSRGVRNPVWRVPRVHLGAHIPLAMRPALPVITARMSRQIPTVPHRLKDSDILQSANLYTKLPKRPRVGQQKFLACSSCSRVSPQCGRLRIFVLILLALPVDFMTLYRATIPTRVWVVPPSLA